MKKDKNGNPLHHGQLVSMGSVCRFVTRSFGAKHHQHGYSSCQDMIWEIDLLTDTDDPSSVWVTIPEGSRIMVSTSEIEVI